MPALKGTIFALATRGAATRPSRSEFELRHLNGAEYLYRNGIGQSPAYISPKRPRGKAVLNHWNGVSTSSLFIPSLPTLDPRMFLGRPNQAWRHWPGLQRGTAQLFYLARAGVYRAIRHFLSPQGGGVVLMPSYHHGVEVEAVRAAGAEVRFYRVDAQMRIDLDDLAKRAEAADVRIVYVTHYVGFAQPIAAALEIARHRGLVLFEDCALSLFSRDSSGRPLGSTGDAAVYCLYKTLPVPHGGLLRGPSDLIDSTVSPPPLLSTLHHAVGLVLAELELEVPWFGRNVRALARGLAHRTVAAVVDNVQTGTMHLDASDLDLGASRLVEHLACRTDPIEVVRRRRENFTRLASQLSDDVLGAPLAPGVCPLFVPLRVDDKPQLLRALRARGIDAIDFWSTGDAAATEQEFPDAARLRREIVELPCHQSLDAASMDAIADAVRTARPRRAGTHRREA